MNSGTAVADSPMTSPLAATEPVVKPNTQLQNHNESGLSSSFTPSMTLEGTVNLTDVHVSAAPVLTGLSRQVGFPAESYTTASTSEAISRIAPTSSNYLRMPRIRLSQEVRQWMTGEFVVIHQRAHQICVEEARRMHLEITELNVVVKRAWEEGSNEMLMEVVVNGNFPQSLALWDAIGDEIQIWGRKQPPLRRRLLEEQYAIFVEAKIQP